MERRWRYQLIQLVRDNARREPKWHIKSVGNHSSLYPVICDHSVNFTSFNAEAPKEREGLDSVPIGDLCEKCLEKMELELNELIKELNYYKQKK